MHIQRMADVRLRRQQPIARLPIVREDEANPARAEHAIAVEHDDRMIVGKFRNRGIATIAVSVARHAIRPSIFRKSGHRSSARKCDHATRLAYFQVI